MSGRAEFRPPRPQLCESRADNAVSREADEYREWWQMWQSSWNSWWRHSRWKDEVRFQVQIFKIMLCNLPHAYSSVLGFIQGLLVLRFIGKVTLRPSGHWLVVSCCLTSAQRAGASGGVCQGLKTKVGNYFKYSGDYSWGCQENASCRTGFPLHFNEGCLHNRMEIA